MKLNQKIYLFFKRIIDILGSLIGIIFCFVFFWWWVIPVNAIVTKGHPLFMQERYGKHKKVFKILKFRSMKNNANSYLAPSDITEDVQKNMETKFGTFLRKTSIDETPQLLNILFGQMSFIGPRPGAAHNEEELVKLRESYSPNAFEVKQGLSGLAQLKLKREHSPKLKAKLDSEYVQKVSFWLDFKLFFMTIFSIFNSNKGK